MTKHRQWFTVRKTPRLVSMVRDLMREGDYVSFAELFRYLVRSAWEKINA